MAVKLNSCRYPCFSRHCSFDMCRKELFL